MALSDISCFLLDMDGTFYLGDRIIEGSLAFIDAVKRTGRDFLFLTNNSSHNAQFYIERLRRMGLQVPREKVLTSGEATAYQVRALHGGKRAFILGNEYLIDEMTENGVPVDQENPEIVIIGYDTTLDYRKMTRVCDLVRAGLPYIATHPDFNCPTETGFAPDIGAIIAFIEASAGRRPDLVVGKPNPGIVEAALKRTGLPAGAHAMVGDRLYTDIETGIRSGMRSILVMSGETTEEMLAASETKPDLKFGRLSDMIELL
ncbi:MAG: HAD-IIA family hydrolase [Christensenellales bacterium]|jgi:HAD superfamily hydrolase (TIGR01457 family)